MLGFLAEGVGLLLKMSPKSMSDLHIQGVSIGSSDLHKRAIDGAGMLRFDWKGGDGVVDVGFREFGLVFGV